MTVNQSKKYKYLLTIGCFQKRNSQSEEWIFSDFDNLGTFNMVERFLLHI